MRYLIGTKEFCSFIKPVCIFPRCFHLWAIAYLEEVQKFDKVTSIIALDSTCTGRFIRYTCSVTSDYQNGEEVTLNVLLLLISDGLMWAFTQKNRKYQAGYRSRRFVLNNMKSILPYDSGSSCWWCNGVCTNWAPFKHISLSDYVHPLYHLTNFQQLSDDMDQNLSLNQFDKFWSKFIFTIFDRNNVETYNLVFSMRM